MKIREALKLIGILVAREEAIGTSSIRRSLELSRSPGIRALTSREDTKQYFEAGRIEESMRRYAIVVEKGPTSYGAYVPDLPGCVAAADTRSEVLRLIREAIEFHIEAMREDGLAVPEPSSSAEYIEVALA
jgi:predicted RNase H-like HicB family nuclease